MARKRLNVKFLVLGLGPVLLLVTGLVAWKVVPRMFPKVRWLVHGTPDVYATKAKALFDEGKYEEAVEQYKFALSLKAEADAPLYTALGDSYSHLIINSDENRDLAFSYYQGALTADPKYLPALERTLKWTEDSAEMFGGPRSVQSWDIVINTGQRILAVDPDHRKAKTAIQRAVLAKWRLGTETSPQVIDDAMNALLALAQRDPFDAEAVFYVLEAMLVRVEQRLAAVDRKGADDVIAQIEKLMVESLAAYPNDAMLHFRCSLVYRSIGFASRGPGQPPKYIDETVRELKLASDLIKPEHELYPEVRTYYARQLMSLPATLKEAETMLRQMLDARPTELSVRIALASVLARNPETQMEAATILEQAPPPDLGRYTGIRAYLVRRYEFTALYDLINIKLDMLPQRRGQPGYEVLLKQAEQTFAKLLAIPNASESPLALQCRGRIELARGQNTQAVQTLARALKVMPNISSGPDAEARLRLMMILSGAYILTNQPGEAKTLLTEVITVIPGQSLARLMLTQLLLQENSIEEARPHLEILKQTLPGDSRVAQLSLRTMDKEKDKDRLWELYQTLPQGTPEEIGTKAQAAIYIERRDEAVKLLETLRTSRPSDAQVRISLARLYSEMGDKPRAVEIADEALALAPSHPQLKLIRAEIAEANVAEVRQGIIDGINDPFRKALLQYELAVQEERIEDANRYLQTAIALKPDDGRVIELQYNRAVIARDWPTALDCVEKLARQNRDQVDGLLYRVRYSLAKGELDQAANQANQLVQRMPEFAPSYVVMGQVQKAQKRYPDAAQSFRVALEKSPREMTAIRELIEIGYLTNNPVLAKEFIDQGRKVFPTYIPLREQELAYESKYGDPTRIIEPREAMLKDAIARKDANESKQWLALGAAYLAAARSRETPAAGRPFLEKGRDSLAQGIAKFPDDIALVDLYASAQVQLGAPADAERAIVALRDREAWKNKPDPTILLSGFYGRVNDTAKQEKVLRDYLATAPAAVPVQIELSHLLARQGKLDESLALLDINAEQPEIRRQRIELQINGKRLEAAEREVKVAIDATPNPSSMLLNRQAYLYMQTNRATEAMAVLNRSLSQSPNDMEALFLQGSLYLRGQTNLPKAIGNLQAARDNRFKELEARRLLAEAYRLSKEPENRVRELEEAVRAFPEDKRVRLDLVNAYSVASPPNWVQAERLLRDTKNLPKFTSDADIANAEVVMWLERKQPARAAQVAVDALRVSPENTELLRGYLQALVDGRNYQNVIAATDPMVQAKKAMPWIYQYRGKARKELGDRAASLQDFQAGLELAWANNDDSGAALILNSIAQDVGIVAARGLISRQSEQKGAYRLQLMMSYLYALENDFETAITWADRVANDADVTPEFRDSAQRQLGSLYLRSTPVQVGKAVAVYRQLVQREPNDIVSLNNLASAMTLPNSGYAPREALEYSERAYKRFADIGEVNSYIYDTHGHTLVLANRLQEGITIMQQAINENPIPDLCLHLGEAYLKLSPPRIVESQEVLKRGLALLEISSSAETPVDPEIKAKLEKVLQQADQMAAPPARGGN